MSNTAPTTFLPIVGTLSATAFLSFGAVLVRWSEVDAFATTFWRAVFSILLLLPLFFILKGKDNRNKSIRQLLPEFKNPAIFLAGIFLGIEVVLFAVGVHYTTIANSNLLINLAPLFVIALEVLIHRKLPSNRFLFGLGMTLVGLYLLIGYQFSFQDEQLLGDFLCFLSAIGFAVYLFLIARYTKKESSFYVIYQTNWSFCLVCFLSMLLFTPFGSYTPTTINGWGVVIAFALCAQLIGHGLVIYAVARLHTNLAVALLLIQPVVAAAYGFFLFNEQLEISEIIGMFIVITGIYIVQYKNASA